jgi:predicted Zn-dependent protease
VLAARAGYSPYGLIEVLHKLSARGSEDGSLALLFKTHPHPTERLSQLAGALAPRAAVLPPGKEPGIRQVSADAQPAGAAKPVPAEGARALQKEEASSPPPLPSGRGSGFGIDPGGVLRGIFGR